MSIISAGFLITVVIIAIIYYVIPKHFQWMLLLFASALFYATYGIQYIGYILFTIISAYCLTRAMARYDDKHKRKRALILGLVLNFGILAVLKYLNFTIFSINSFWGFTHAEGSLPYFHIIMPLGISFYTFQIAGYVIDVYHKKYEPETNIFKFALFVAYFPQLLQGPIGRYDRLAPQFFAPHTFDIKNAEYGAQRIAWGLAKKLIIADRAYAFANAVFSSVDSYQGMYVVIGLLVFSAYEYCDFSGGIDIVIGVSEIFGIKLDENFRQPYFSKSIGEFWRRWHITLGTWMKDYIFYPFSISKKVFRLGKKAQKIFGKQMGKMIPICMCNILIFFIVGIWHGSELKYLIYGFYNGIIIALSNLLKPYYARMAVKCHINTQGRVWQIVQVLRTFILVNIGWLFDACNSANDAFKAFGNIFKNFGFGCLMDGSLINIGGFTIRDWRILIIACVILFITSVMKEKGVDLRDYIAEKPLPVRWVVYLVLIFSTAPFGFVTNSTGFMYAQF